MTLHARITDSAMDAAARLLTMPAPSHIDTTLSARIRSSRIHLQEANRRGDLFAAACAVEQLQEAVEEFAA